ncbi:toxin YdaT family protein [Citrobacter braakii]|uniref:toxin YdaT family protein n=1 Tax=Citrobacter braakii TaxID=57706 RepID=UPI002B24751E|nr:toxin YdaT family protein [Citrobacter braakii]MEB0968295.1 toxin YdaT family protein [Citrobacter braakii]
MLISNEKARDALNAWLRLPTVTQEYATQVISREFLAQPTRPEIAVHHIEFNDGTVDYAAWRRNRINIFQRWRKLETQEHREKFTALIPAILEAIRKDAPELHKQVTAGESIEYLVTRLLKESTEAANASLLGAPLHDFERECDEAIHALQALRNGYRQQYQRCDQ